MGSLLFANRKLDNLAIVRDIVQSILPEEREAQIALNSDNLWELNQRRHLIVHQRGLVDDTYLKRTADKASMGDRLEVTSHQLEKYILTVREVIQQLLKSVVRQSP